jgi:hypothetical protein
MTTTADIITLFPLSAEVAWQRYLEDTRGRQGDDYAAAEAEAWARLQVALGRVRQPPDDAA